MNITNKHPCFTLALSTVLTFFYAPISANDIDDLDTIENAPLYVGCYCAMDELSNDHEYQVLKQLESYSPSSFEEKEMLYNLEHSDLSKIRYTLNKLSGSQYSQLMITTESTNSRFLRRLYDPLRPVLAYYPSRAEKEEEACSRGFDPEKPNVNYWLINNYGKQTLSDSSKNYGFKSSNYEIAIGAQYQYNRSLTLGVAGFYEYTDTRFNLSGSGFGQTFLAGIYFAKSHRNYYVFADLIGGATTTTVKRSTLCGFKRKSDNGNINSTQGSFYVEGGVNFNFHSYFLFQPFLGLEIGGYNFDKFSERRSDFTKIILSSKSYGTIASRLGVHFSSLPNICGLYYGIDLAWVCMWNDTQHSRNVRFRDFGCPFSISNTEVSPNALFASFNVSKKMSEDFSLFSTVNYQGNCGFHSCDVLVGIRSEW